MALSTKAKALLIGGGAIASILIVGRARANPDDGRGGTIPNNGGGGGGGRKRNPNAPAGSGSAIVAPVVLPNDPPKYAYGLLVHERPDSASPLFPGLNGQRAEDSSATSIHANTGDEVVVLQTNVAGGGRIWWRVMTPLMKPGQSGYVVAIDNRTTPPRPNFTAIREPTVLPPQNIAAGYPQIGARLGYTPYAQQQAYGYGPYGHPYHRRPGR